MPNGKAEAQEGRHDDLVMGLAIAHYIRPQQKYTLLNNQNINENYKMFSDDKNSKIYDETGDKIEII